MADKQIFELPDITLDILNSGLDIGFVAQVEGYGLDFKVPHDILLSYFNSHPSMDIYSGSSNPGTPTGNNGDIYFQTNGKIYLKRNGVWVLKAVLPISGSPVVQYPVTVTAGQSLPIVFNFSDHPGIDKNAEFIYIAPGPLGQQQFFDLTPVMRGSGPDYTGFNLYPHSNDGGVTSAENATITVVSSATGDISEGSLLSTANDWPLQQTFDQPIKLKNSGHLLSLIASLSGDHTQTFQDKTGVVANLDDITAIFAAANEWAAAQTFDAALKLKSGSFFASLAWATQTANHTWTIPNKTDTAAGLSDIPAIPTQPIILRLLAAGDGISLTVSLPHGQSGVTSSWKCEVTINSADAGPYSEVVFFDVDATNVNIHYDVARPIPISGNNLIYTVTLKP